MSRSFSLSLTALTALTAFTACSDKGAVDTADTADTASSATINADIRMLDIIQGTPAADATLTYNGETLAGDAEGYVNLDLPQNATLTLQGDAPGYMTGSLSLFTLDEYVKSYVPMLPLAARDAISAQLGIPYDATKGLLGLRVYTRDAAGALLTLGGATVDLDVAYSVALSSDQTQPGGLVPSNVTVSEAESLAQITFLDVPAGPVNVTVTPPEGVSDCTWYRGDTPLADFSPVVLADTMNGANIVCL